MKKLAIVAVAATLAAVANAQWSDNFDGYANGTQLHGVGGWAGWGNSGAAGALVTNAQSSSPPHSVDIVGASDLVHEFTGATSGIWEFSGEVYIPGSYQHAAGQGSFFIMMNEYTGSNGDWSVQMEFDGGTDMVVQNGGSGNTFVETQTAIVYDQWVGFDFTIDLDANSVVGRYNNVTVLTGQWYNPASGTKEIKNIDLFANNASSVFYDNLQLQVVPEPGTFVALGIGLAGLAALRRRK